MSHWSCLRGYCDISSKGHLRNKALLGYVLLLITLHALSLYPPATPSNPQNTQLLSIAKDLSNIPSTLKKATITPHEIQLITSLTPNTKDLFLTWLIQLSNTHNYPLNSLQKDPNNPTYFNSTLSKSWNNLSSLLYSSYGPILLAIDFYIPPPLPTPATLAPPLSFTKTNWPTCPT